MNNLHMQYIIAKAVIGVFSKVTVLIVLQNKNILVYKYQIQLRVIIKMIEYNEQKFSKTNYLKK